MNLMQEAGEWVSSLTVALALALFINIFIFQPTTVMGPSMQPTLHEGERIFLSKLSHTFGKMPAYGDVVVIDSRVDRPRTMSDDISDPVVNVITMVEGGQPAHNIWVKRVIGLPGDSLEFKDGKVYRNGKVLTESYITQEPMRYTSEQKIVVPEGHIFVMGDNRNNSSDSRIIGSLPLDHVLGVMVFKI